jgi:hypothetical protein
MAIEIITWVNRGVAFLELNSTRHDDHLTMPNPGPAGLPGSPSQWL